MDYVDYRSVNGSLDVATDDLPEATLQIYQPFPRQTHEEIMKELRIYLNT
jgi:hypothetical protein